jgi:hypothetical protein
MGGGPSGDHKIHGEFLAKCDTSEFKQYKGWANIPLACLRMQLEFPYVADQAKYDLLKWEFVGGKKKRYEDDRYMGAMNGLVGEVVRLGQDKEKPQTMWIAGWLGPDDYDALLELVCRDRRD